MMLRGRRTWQKMIAAGAIDAAGAKNSRADAGRGDGRAWQKASAWTLRALVWLAAGLTMGAFVLLVGYVLVKGIPNLNAQLFAWNYTSENVSMMPALMGTILMTAVALAISAPLGILSAVYLVEYARRESKWVALVRLASETLSGIPSIVYGLFGLLFFVTRLGWGYSMMAGAATLAIMTLPLIMRTTEEALLSVPDSYREGCFGLGAGRLRTVFSIVLPSAAPGILSGIILAIGRIVGETAALIYTAGTVAQLPNSLFSSVRTLAVHMYSLSSEGLHVGAAYATAAVLLIVVVVINALSGLIAGRISKG
ncbi:MAG: phosphate ABC transporter permease PstA [Clostridia bacterium]